jgi:hypothetical protein
MHTIYATDGTNSFSNAFIVFAPRLVTTPPGTIITTTNSGSPGSNVDLYIKGFAGNDPAKPITISVDGVPIGTPVMPNMLGSYKAFPVTAPMIPGPHIISATDGIRNVSMTFYVVP